MVKNFSNAELISALYRALLRRDSDEAGMAHYAALLSGGAFSVADMIKSLMDSPEYEQIHGIPSLNAGQAAFRNPVSKNAGVYQTIDAVIFGDLDPGYMQAANCVGSDFFAPAFRQFCDSIRHHVALHRKLWEFAFVVHHLAKKGALREGARGVGFGVGTEPLPSLFASLGCEVLATDAPVGVAAPGWSLTNQHSQSREQLFRKDIVASDVFEARVRFACADMNAIDDSIRDFDFCWSSCCFEHLGDIEKGLDFVEASVEKTLKSGGVACHTSELNLSSNDETIASGDTVLFRRKDIERLISRLERRGHYCEPLPFNSGSSFIDHLVDAPEGGGDIHIKLRLGSYVTTSFGIVVVKGGLGRLD